MAPSRRNLRRPQKARGRGEKVPDALCLPGHGPGGPGGPGGPRRMNPACHHSSRCSDTCCSRRMSPRMYVPSASVMSGTRRESTRKRNPCACTPSSTSTFVTPARCRTAAVAQCRSWRSTRRRARKSSSVAHAKTSARTRSIPRQSDSVSASWSDGLGRLEQHCEEVVAAMVVTDPARQGWMRWKCISSHISMTLGFDAMGRRAPQ